MREIKYRFWDSNTNGGCFNDFCDLVIYDGGVYEFEGDYDGCLDPRPNIIAQQYTGLKDKNGVEIYEGDIIMENVHYFVDCFKDASILGTDKNGNRTYTRIEKKPMHIFLDAKKGWNLRSDTYNYKSSFWVKDDVFFNKIEVIGNIYENPELIK